MQRGMIAKNQADMTTLGRQVGPLTIELVKTTPREPSAGVYDPQEQER